MIQRGGALTAIVGAVAITAVTSGCGGSKGSSPATGTVASTQTTTTSSSNSVRIGTSNLSGLGTVLVDAQGRTLYMFVPDKRMKVTCVGSCAAVWPPAKLPKGRKPVAVGQAMSSLLGSDPNPAGGRVVTYAGWPLYTYVADTSPGMATGQALNLNGGLWYVLAPSGKVIRKKPAGATSY